MTGPGYDGKFDHGPPQNEVWSDDQYNYPAVASRKGEFHAGTQHEGQQQPYTPADGSLTAEEYANHAAHDWDDWD